MDAVTVSPKYQVVIPLKVRERMRVKPGQKVRVIAKLTSHALRRLLRRAFGIDAQTFRVAAA